jgi:hypothetical protein
MNMSIVDGVAVVREDNQRLRWRRSGTAWVLHSVWPDPAERRQLEGHRARGHRVLVVVSDLPPVTAFHHEVTSIVGVDVVAQDGDFLDLQAPLLNWLPADQRRRGLRFLDQARAEAASTPTGLRPPFLVDGASAMSRLRFAYRTSLDVRVSDPVMRSLVQALAIRERVPA